MLSTSKLYNRRKAIGLTNGDSGLNGDVDYGRMTDSVSLKKQKVFILRRRFILLLYSALIAYWLVHIDDIFNFQFILIGTNSLSIPRPDDSIATNLNTTSHSSKQDIKRSNSTERSPMIPDNTDTPMIPAKIAINQNTINSSSKRDIKSNNSTERSPMIPDKTANPMVPNKIETPNKSKEPAKIEPPPKSYKFAYAFLMAGCDPINPAYMGYIYNAVVSKEILRLYNSTADVVMLVRMHGASIHERLPDKHVSLLTKSGIIVKYLPKTKVDNFHTAMMEKFRILELVQYDRIIYLDSDVMPLNNLDYLFKLSVGKNAPLQENVILAYSREPANGGFFMLKPDREDYKRITEIISKMNRRNYKFDPKVGFGHEIVKPDYWESIYNKNTAWDFYGAFTDQGLLYHWVKYEKKKFTAIIGNKVKSFDEDKNGNVAMIRNVKGDKIFNDVQEYSHLKPILKVPGLEKVKPYQDFQHFFQDSKPWFNSVQRPPSVKRIDQTTSPLHLWYHILRESNTLYDFGVNAELMRISDPPLGVNPHISMVNSANK